MLSLDRAMMSRTIQEISIGLFFICLLSNLVSIATCSELAFDKVQVAKAYEVIDDYLVDNVDLEDIDINVEALQKYRQELVVTKTTSYEPVLHALDQIIAQINIANDPNGCSKEGHEIIRQNNMATQSRTSQKRKSRVPCRRVELILHHYSTVHAINCYDKYVEVFKNLYEATDKSSWGQIDTFLNAIMKRRMAEQQSKSRRRKSPSLRKMQRHLMDGYDSIKNDQDVSIAAQVIRELSKRDLVIRNSTRQLEGEDKPDGDDLEDQLRSQLKSLVWHYLIDPCEKYVQTFGSDVFIPIQQDSNMLPVSLRHEYENRSATLLIGRVRFGFCNIVMRDRYWFANQVVNAANSFM